MLGEFAKFRKWTINFFLSVFPSAYPSVRMKQFDCYWIFMKFDIRVFFENSVVSLKSDKNNGYFT